MPYFSRNLTRVVLFSGGLGSWAAALRTIEQYGKQHVKLLFCDTKMEDEDLYRFLEDAERDLGVPVTRIADGRDPWMVFFDNRFLGNSQVDPCSRELKRELSDDWHKCNFTPLNCIRVCGIDWSEEHRYVRLKARLQPWQVEAPMCDPPYLTRTQVRALAESRGLRVPRLYDLGFDHNNCGGFCIKAGQAHFAHLLKILPARYAYHENKEQEIRTYLGKDVAILRDRKGGTSKPLTLRDFRLRLQAGGEYDCEEWGGCSCFSGPETVNLTDEETH